MAGRASEIGMAICQQKTCGAVIELCAEPAIETVALVAFARGESRSGFGVIWIGGVLPILQMARIALCFKAQELPDRRTLMAGVARHSSMRTKEGKAVLVILNLFGRKIPAFDGVALRTIATRLPPMNVRVAVGAILADVGENRLDVTLDAFHLFVHPT